MDIPHRLIEEVVETVEVHLRCEIHWKTAMLLVRQLETKAKYPDLSQYAPNLEDSESMQRGWRMARLQRMDEIEWIKRKEKRVEIELFTEENQKKFIKMEKTWREIAKNQEKA
uniref:Phage protein n=1 Tax=Caenorhabditis tropicalis TaxID=1561998 RepID=A0A1I7TS99_9PELO